MVGKLVNKIIVEAKSMATSINVVERHFQICISDFLIYIYVNMYGVPTGMLHYGNG